MILVWGGCFADPFCVSTHGFSSTAIINRNVSFGQGPPGYYGQISAIAGVIYLSLIEVNFSLQ